MWKDIHEIWLFFFAAHAVEYVECAAIYIFKMKNTYATYT